MQIAIALYDRLTLLDAIAYSCCLVLRVPR